MSLYFIAWLVPSGMHDSNGGPKYFIYLTNWAFLLFNSYLLVSAISVTLQFVIHYTYVKQDLSRHDLFVKRNDLNGKEKVVRVLLGADYTMEVVWYQKIQWLLVSVGLGGALAIPILYWSVVYSSSHELDGTNFNTHLVNGIVALFDLWFSGIIIRLFHVVYLVSFGAIYVIFSGIYYAGDGTNAQGDPYIYSSLDYGDKLGQAIILVVLAVLLFLPLVYSVMYAMYGIRYWLAKKACTREYNDETVEQI